MSEINPDYVKQNADYIPRWHNSLDFKGAMAILMIGQDVKGQCHVFKDHRLSPTETANLLRGIAAQLDRGLPHIDTKGLNIPPDQGTD